MGLSKTLYIRGLKCKKSLWLKKHKSYVLTEPDKSLNNFTENKIEHENIELNLDDLNEEQLYALLCLGEIDSYTYYEIYQDRKLVRNKFIIKLIFFIFFIFVLVQFIIKA